MTKTKGELVRGEVNGYHPSMFFAAYEKYRRKFWLGTKNRKVKNNGLDNVKDKKRSGRISRTKRRT